MDLVEDDPPLVRVRRWAGEVLSDLAGDELDGCLLVVTELVSNAYDHGQAPRTVRLHRTPRSCFVRVEVDDAAFGEVVVGRSRLGAQRGRGMVLVVNLSTAWGVDRHERGKTVWAEVPCAALEVSG
ncbi:hypothetical protein EKG83_22400 [Saccharothrix syringae]|uniref:Histidine kinase/HSP90-like ATPase domain-containing protein n=2 Tax=Saccharothrix syringae TaxID=103733 RepID=A0A5Q0HE17_SACSY|nr:hypothetical protein EKG83_22400 [Saccharothrix syringae]